jgi:hypothetical protein
MRLLSSGRVNMATVWLVIGLERLRYDALHLVGIRHPTRRVVRCGVRDSWSVSQDGRLDEIHVNGEVSWLASYSAPEHLPGA